MSRKWTSQVCNMVISCLVVMSMEALAADQTSDKTTDAQFRAMDTNDDGKLSPDEHAAGAKKMFDTMDANKDG